MTKHDPEEFVKLFTTGKCRILLSDGWHETQARTLTFSYGLTVHAGFDKNGLPDPAVFTDAGAQWLTWMERKGRIDVAMLVPLRSVLGIEECCE